MITLTIYGLDQFVVGNLSKELTGKIAELANGNVIVRYGETVVMVNVTMSKEARDLTYESIAPFVAEYKASQEAPVCPHIEEIAIIDPFLLEIIEGATSFEAYVVNPEDKENNFKQITLKMDPLTEDEKTIVLKGCLINYYKEILKDNN